MKPWYIMKMNLKLWMVKHLLPRWVVYYALVVAGAYASTGQYSNTVVPDLNIIEVMRRWEMKK